jgi:Glycosyl hydrolase family 26
VNGKIGAALAMPFAVAVTVGGIVIGTHHATLPSALTATASVQKRAACKSEVRHFAGIAAASQSSQFDPVTYREYAMPSGGIFEFYTSFPRKFDVAGAEHAVQLHAVPLIQLNPGKRHPKVIRQIANGVYDPQIRQYADAVKHFKSCVIISFGHEMNGWWYRWGGRWTKPATFIKAWRHVHDIFEEQHATNVIWSFDPSHQYQQLPKKSHLAATPAGKWYPGSKYVDIIGLDGYLGLNNKGLPQSFGGIFGFQINNLKKFDKPIYLAETAVSPGPHAAAQIADLFAGIKANHLAGLVWFDAVGKHDYRLGINNAEDVAYKKGLAGFLKKP